MTDQLAIGYVFGLGMVAVFNPCGFAMLPAWIAYFLTSEQEEPGPTRGVARALVIGGVLTSGFVVVFLTIGLLVQLASSALIERLPWVSIVVGVAMVVVGAAILFGGEIKVQLPITVRAPRSRSLGAVFGFGISYALISLACTIPLFLATVTASMTGGSLGVGLLHFLAYAAGMGVILTALTVGLSMAQATLIGRLRQVGRYMRPVAAVLLAVAGAYVAYYGWYQLRVYGGDLDPGGPAQFGYDLSAWMSGRINDVGPVRIALIAMVVIAAALFVTLLARREEPSERAQSGSEGPTGEGRPASAQQPGRT